MTEDEAKTKMCCGPPAVAASAYYTTGVSCDAPMHCIGSACMAWREYRPLGQADKSGFCGLAGAPK